MSLNWNVTKCKNSEELVNEKEWPITNALIWLTMIVGIGHITEKKVPEFLARVRFIEKLQGTYFLSKDGKNLPIEKEWVLKRVGLKTNVSDITRNQFVKLKTDRWFKENVIELNEVK